MKNLIGNTLNVFMNAKQTQLQNMIVMTAVKWRF